ncbi:chlorophyllase [Deinococcus sp. HMF7620]|uniref:Chlorophyllase n=1 Tax=Deinococcus arboris TaxID=2682977 RepID=A0A7C9I4K9_9DEIO|nr:chlorophyllase [Deinococcus arboris]MVN88251.1 chlorophyllase [Deinococcus arboris]
MSLLPPAAPILSVTPIVLPAPSRGEDIQVRVTAPLTGQQLPVILFSHGHGSSLYGYGPLTDFWAAHGFAVVQVTHLDSRMLRLPSDDPRRPEIWRSRVEDLKHILDHLPQIEDAVPGLGGRLDHGRVAAAGHSWGGHTVGVLLGARVLDGQGQPGEDLSDARIQAGVLLAPPGRGGADLSPTTARRFPFLNVSFADMRTPALVVAGDHETSSMSLRGADWRADPYRLSPGAKSLLTITGAAISLGGIPGYEAAETTDESPERVALIQQVTWAYLRSALHPQDSSWSTVRSTLAAAPHSLARLEDKSEHPFQKERF